MKELLIAALCLGTLAACGGSGGGDMTEEPSGADTGGGDTGGDDTGGGDTAGGDTGGGDTSGGDTGGIDISSLSFDANLLAVNSVFPTNTFRESTEFTSTPDGSNGYAFQVGVLDDDTGLIANANILTGGLGFSISPAPATGTVTLQSTYNATLLSNPTGANGQVEVTTTESADAPITLTADFSPAGFATLTGTDGTLTVDGTFSSVTTSLNGTVTYRGVEGDLTGFVGGAEAIGAFAGSDDTSVFAGGFTSD